MFPSHLSTFQATAQELISIDIGDINVDYIKTTPEWLNLFTVMFHCYFQYMRTDRTRDTAPDPLIDALLLICDCTDLPVLSQKPGFRLMFSVITRCVGEGLSSPDSSDIRASLFSRLKALWNEEKKWKLRHDPESLMPWSMDSIKEGSLSSTCPSSTVNHFN